MVEECLEEGDLSQLAPLTSPKSVQISVDPKPTEGTNEDDNSESEKIASVNFEAHMQQELPASLILIANNSNLQEISLEQKASIVDSVTVSSEVDNGELPSVKEDPCGFPSECNEVNESKEDISDLIAMQPSEDTHAASQTLVTLGNEVQITPLHKVQEGVYFPVPEKIACEMRPAIRTKVKEDKPRVLHERQMSLGDTRHKVPAPVSRENSGKYLRTNETFVDTTNPIESVKVAASRFGGSINWKTRRTQPLQGSEHAILEVDRLKKEISECKQQAEAAETAKLSVFNEIERTKKLIEQMKHDLERAQIEDAQAKEDLEIFQFIVQEINEGAASDDSVAAEILKNIQERQEAMMSKLKLVKNELENVQEDYDSLLIEQATSIGKSQAALTVCKETGQQAEELTVELGKLKEVLYLARVTCHDAEEHKIRTSLACEEECLTWEKDLRQAEEELIELDMKISSVEDLKSKLETSSNLLLKCNDELTACMEAKLTEDAQEQEKKTHESRQEIILSRNELEEHMKSIDKLRGEVSALKVDAASLQSELSKKKTTLASTQQLEAMASITIRSLKLEIELAQQELEAVQSKEKEYQDRMVEFPKILQAASQEADKAKSVATKAQEQLRKTKEEVEQAKAGLGSMELRLQAVLKEMEAAKESERLALDALRALDSEVAVNIEGQGSPETITLNSDDHASLIEKSHQAEELAHEKTSYAIAQVKEAKESESLILSTLGKVYKVLEERNRAFLAAKEQDDRASEGKLAMEQELRKWREENAQRRKAIEALKSSETKPPNTMVIIVDRSGDSKGAGKEDSYMLVHPLSDMSARSSPSEGSALQAKKSSNAKKPPFFQRMIMFLARRRLKAA